MNVDTDTQYAFTRPVAAHMFSNYDGVLKVDGEVGNKKAYDPRAWGKAAEAGMAARVVEACENLRSAGKSDRLTSRGVTRSDAGARRRPIAGMRWVARRTAPRPGRRRREARGAAATAAWPRENSLATCGSAIWSAPASPCADAPGR